MTDHPNDALAAELAALPIRTEVLDIDRGITGAQSVEVPIELRDRILAALNIEAQPVAWKPMTDTAWLDGRDVVLFAHDMEIHARYCPGEWSDDTPISPREYSGAAWVAFDDQVQFEIEEINHNAAEWQHGPVTHWREPTHPLYAHPPTDTLARLQCERDQAVEALRELQEQLAKAQSPQWFYHPEYTDICEFGPWEVIESYDLKPGKHVVEIQTARPLPSIWSVVHVLTNAEKDEMETDDAWMVQDFTTEAEARAALAAIEGAEQ